MSNRAFQKAKAKGIKVKIIAPLTKRASSTVKKLSPFAQIKSVDHISARFCVVDGKEITFMLLSDKEIHPSYDVGVWINTKFFANAMEGVFDTLWSGAKPADKTRK